MLLDDHQTLARDVLAVLDDLLRELVRVGRRGQRLQALLLRVRRLGGRAICERRLNLVVHDDCELGQVGLEEPRPHLASGPRRIVRGGKAPAQTRAGACARARARAHGMAARGPDRMATSRPRRTFFFTTSFSGMADERRPTVWYSWTSQGLICLHTSIDRPGSRKLWPSCPFWSSGPSSFAKLEGEG